jgi:4'-phosphopantetheinyl transferase
MDLVVSTDHLRVWVSDLDRQRDDSADLELLSKDERVRAARFHFDVHRRRFVACRALLRRLVAAELGAAPRDVSFQYGPFGKPALAGESDLKFNVSHSDRYALLGLTRGRDVGIDIERVRTTVNLDHLAERVFSPAEQEEFFLVPTASRAEAFFSGWTRKEAYIKARGDGLQRLADFDVSLGPGEPARLRRVQGEPDEPARWSLVALTPVPGFAAAACLEEPAIRRLR